MNRIRTAVIGTGFMGRVHLEALRRVEHVDVVEIAATSAEKAQIVETAPGWTHDITNIGADEMIVMLWANEVFDRQRSDTFACPL